MHTFTTATICCFFFSMIGHAQSTELFDKLLYTRNKQTLPYRLLKPVNPQAEDRFPLIIFLHGSEERGNDNESHLSAISNLFLNPNHRGKFPCYVLAPQCPKDELWAPYDIENPKSKELTKPAQLVMELIDEVSKEFPIDPSRIYLTGLSMGGYGVWDLLAHFPDKFAAGVPICGAGDYHVAPKIKHIPIWAFHGAKDSNVSPQLSRTMISALQRAGGHPGYTEYPDIEHSSWIQAYQEPHLLPWLFTQKLHADKQ
jgi:predicted peptidase